MVLRARAFQSVTTVASELLGWAHPPLAWAAGAVVRSPAARTGVIARANRPSRRRDGWDRDGSKVGAPMAHSCGSAERARPRWPDVRRAVGRRGRRAADERDTPRSAGRGRRADLTAEPCSCCQLAVKRWFTPGKFFGANRCQ